MEDEKIEGSVHLIAPSMDEKSGVGFSASIDPEFDQVRGEPNEIVDATLDSAHGLSIRTEIAPKVTFATEQAGIPILRDLIVANSGDEDQEAIDVEISADPPFLVPRTWRIDRVSAGSEISIRDRNVELDGGFLFGLTDAMQGTVTIQARRADVGSSADLLWQDRRRVRILARNEWGGAGTMPELLASFVQPNDPGAERMVKAAAGVLRSISAPDETSRTLDAYSSGKRQHVWTMINALWVAIGREGLDYAQPPASFETEGQKIRRPEDVLTGGLATCLDSVVLFASALEQMGLHPMVILTKGHAFVGVWLVPEKFASIIGEDVVDVRKRVDSDDILVFETTLAVQHPPAPLSSAVAHAKQALKNLGEADPNFRLIDIARARAQRFTPLPSFVRPPDAPADVAAEKRAVELPIEQPPALPDFDIKPKVSDDDTPATRVDRWKRRLLDLSLRNKMLNWRSGKGSIPILCKDAGLLEDRLSEGSVFRIRELPDLGRGTRDGEDGRRDEEIVRRRLGEPIVDSTVQEGLGSGLLFSTTPQKDLDARLVELFRRAKNDLQEGGANTLYLAAGMLRWKKSARDTKSYFAPLVLIPVTLQRKSARSAMTLKHLDEEARFNSTLLRMLQDDFAIRVPELESELPQDDSGIDMPKIFAWVRERVKDVPGFEVEADHLILSTFSFAKYLMWKDLEDRTEQLKQNDLVRHLIETPRESFSDGVDFPEGTDLDDRYHPKNLFLVKPADSSQLQAVAAGAEGKNFVLIGPPGTGKSQTITNLISQALGMGRTVLFFAEKTAALEVVYRRLREEGLGEFCLEVHSSKARKLDVLEQLERAWEASGDLSAQEWEKEADRLAELRGQLNGFVEALHRRHANGWSAFRALSVVVAGDGLDAPTLSWPSIDYHDAEAYEAIERVAEDLQVSGKEVRELTGSVFEAIAEAEWSPTFQSNIIERAQKVISASDRCLDAERRFLEATTLNVPLSGRSRRREYWERGLACLAEALATAHSTACDMVFSSALNDLSGELKQTVELLQGYADAKASLIGRYREDAESRLQINTLLDQAARARAAWWPKSTCAMRPVVKAMRAETEGGHLPRDAVQRDLPVLKRMRDIRKALETDIYPLARGLGRVWRGVDTNPRQLEQTVNRLVAIRDATSSLAGDVERIGRLQAVLTPLLTTAQDMLAPTGAVGSTVQDLREAHDALHVALDDFEHVAHGRIDRHATVGGGQPAEDLGWIETLKSDAQRIVAGEAAINRWCNWRRDRIRGEALGLGPILEGVERGTVDTDRIIETVRLAFARWWLNGLVDRDRTLREFNASRHSHMVDRFRELDDRFRALTRMYLRAKIASTTPNRSADHQGTQFSVLQRELSKKRNHKPLRQLMSEMPKALLNLTPCLLMSPLSVAQYLAADSDLFDVAIIDEGSQVTVWDAVGPLARANQAIIVGDPKQLPPTTFFQRGDDDDEVDEAIDEDLESILDEAIGANVPKLKLEWHYRSRSESLIAFSNQQYYDGRLVTFPSPKTDDKAVHLIRIEQGIYERGKSRTNPSEARAIVAELTARLEKQAHLPLDRQISYGVVTFNSEQQRLIEDLLDEEVRGNPAIEQFFDATRSEPVMVKNLESVQGDERDVMMFSITYARDQSGRLAMNFGPLNRPGGERRLNVAITRARIELLVYSSIVAGDLDLSRTSALGVHDLKHFLDYAERGARALGEMTRGSVGGHDSPFEAAVSEALTARGWHLIPQVGVGGFRIDLGVVHPDAPGRFLAGIEADGATYHSGRTARDRDLLRQQILGSLGWEILRIWSTDWWIDRRSALDTLDRRLKELLEADRERVLQEREAAAAEEARRLELLEELRSGAPGEDDEDPGESSVGNPGTGVDGPDGIDGEDADEAEVLRVAHRAELPTQDVKEPGTLPSATGHEKRYTRIDDVAAHYDVSLQDVKAFMTDAARAKVTQVLETLIDAEGPVERSDVISRVAKGFGFRKAGSKIRAYIEECMPPRPTTEEDETVFLWPRGSIPGVIPFRAPATDEDRRLVPAIPIEELTGLAKTLPDNLSQEDAIARMARRIGLQRVTAGARAKMERAWAKKNS